VVISDYENSQSMLNRIGCGGYNFLLKCWLETSPPNFKTFILVPECDFTVQK